MNADLAEFVAAARRHPRFSLHLRDVLSTRLPSAVWVDACVLAGDVAISALIDAGGASIELPAKLQHAYELAYPSEHAQQGLADFLRSHGEDADALRGIASTLKGKMYEVAYIDYLNAGHLPEGQVAFLAESPTQAGFDIEVVAGHLGVVDRLNMKATSAASYVQEHLDRYPGIDAVTTVEAAAHFPDHAVVGFGSIEDVDSSVGHVFESQAGHAQTLGRVPWLSMGLLAYEAFRQSYLRDQPPGVVLDRVASRGLWLGIGTLGSKAGTAVAGSAWGGIAVVILITAARKRASTLDALGLAIDGHRDHLRLIHEALLKTSVAEAAES